MGSESVKKCLFVFGTRPEAIKMAPLIREFRQESSFDTRVCITSQHREMLDQVLGFFGIKADYDLDLMRPDQNLYELTASILTGMKTVLDDFEPDYVLVHGDTTTTMAAGLAAFYKGAKVCHVEAGLRTFNKNAPFPEEMNRVLTGRLADYHFAPTQTSLQNLLDEGVDAENVLLTGNTVIDALLESVAKVNAEGYFSQAIEKLKQSIDMGRRIVLVTAHRRENQGDGFVRMCEALKKIAREGENVQLVYPVHLNPNVRKQVFALLSDCPNILLLEPLSYEAFVWLMDKSTLIITDSGGIQEEAPTLGKPVLVMRERTERPEAVEAGTVILVGTGTEKIVNETLALLSNEARYQAMSQAHNPYGDGKAAARIRDFMKRR